MSVINKMLRDLDQQSGAGAAASAPRAAPAEIMRGTVSVPGLAVLPAEAGRGRRTVRFAVLLLLIGTALAAFWLWPGSTVQPAVAPVALVVTPPAPVALPAPVVVSAPPVVESAPAPAVVAAPVVPPMSAAQPAMPNPPAQAAPRPPGALVAPAPVSVPATVVPGPPKLAAPDAAPPVRAEGSTIPVPRPATTVFEPRSAAANWQEAAQDALGQAQRLWAGGSRETAADILREALSVVERTHSAEMTGAGAVVVLSMLRELVRMDMAMGQEAQVLALLKRFERVAASQSDLWALRGNAGQRLAQHADAALAYQNALRLRPGEPRWMLGAAVSLAAQGQTAAAAEFAEQARALTTVSPDVLAYLRQAGVPLR